MTLFQRYALIYESSMTLAVHEDVAAEPGQDMPQMEAPLPVAPVKLLDSSVVAVMDEVAEIGSGWWSDPPPPVPPVQIQLGDIEAVLDEVAEIGSGWWSDPPPLVFPHLPVYVLDLVDLAEVAIPEGDVFSESPGPVPAVQIQLSGIEAVLDEIAEIGSGWWSDPPPPVPSIQIQLSSIEFAEEVAAIEVGWWSDPPPLVPPIKGQVSSIEFAEEIEAIEGGWWTDPPPPVPAVKVPPGTIAFALEIPDIGSGWWSDPPPPVPPIQMLLSTIEVVDEEVEALGGVGNSDLVIVHFPYVLIYQSLSGPGPVPDEIPEIGSGWWSDPPPPVPPIKIQLGSIQTVLQDIPEIGSGWWSDAPGPVAPIRVPDSSIAFAEEVDVSSPPSRIRRLRELGMGILKRQQLG